MTQPRVLLVDDEPALLHALATALRREPWELVTATSAAEALALVDAAVPAVVVSDHDMPGMTGAELLRHIARRQPQTMRMMLTGRGDLNVAMRAINEGEVFRFFTKPLAAKELAAAIREALALAASRPVPTALTARAEQTRVDDLEADAPGITRVRTTQNGAIVVTPPQEDLAALIAAATAQQRGPAGGGS